MTSLRKRLSFLYKYGYNSNQPMKKYILLFGLMMLACSSLVPTPDDFPPPPMTVIVELPVVTPTTILEPRLAPITSEKMTDAQSFQLILLTMTMAGDSMGIAELVKYPLTVQVNGEVVISNADDFNFYYNDIFNDRVIQALSDTSEANLNLLPEGVRVGRGEIWFNLFCVDLTCSDTQFLITQINNQE